MSSQELVAQFDPPYETFDNSMLGPEFPAELDLVSRLWFLTSSLESSSAM